MIDTLIYQGLTLPNLQSYISDGTNWRVWPKGALGHVGIPAAPEFPYIQHGDGGGSVTPVTKDLRHTLVLYWDVYVYDAPGSYSRIKTILELVKDNLESMAGLVTAGGVWRATEIVHSNYSDDVYDAVRQQNNKRASFRVVASRAK